MVPQASFSNTARKCPGEKIWGLRNLRRKCDAFLEVLFLNLDVSEDTALRDLKKMMELKIIEKAGVGKATIYQKLAG